MSEALRKFILALAAQIPLAGGLYLKWNQVQQSPVLAATIGLLYELVVVAGAFSKKVWAELEKDAINATADWARAAARNFKPGFRRRYNSVPRAVASVAPLTTYSGNHARYRSRY
jgi:hypothetical protein